VLWSTVPMVVATMTLNRPDSMNSLSVELKEALVAAVRDLAADESVRAVVVTGAGRAFCVGQICVSTKRCSIRVTRVRCAP